MKKYPLPEAAAHEGLHSPVVSGGRRHQADGEDPLVAERADNEVAVVEPQHETGADRVAVVASDHGAVGEPGPDEPGQHVWTLCRADLGLPVLVHVVACVPQLRADSGHTIG